MTVDTPARSLDYRGTPVAKIRTGRAPAANRPGNQARIGGRR
ncbi:hypothetical protein [Streptomyces sp. T028]